MARVTRIEGLDRLRRKLDAIPREVGADMRQAFAQNGDELTAMQKRMAPVDERDLQNSIQWVFGDGDQSRVGLKGQFGLSIVVTAGTENDGDAYYARWVEFGTSDGKPAQPFFFPSYRLMKRRMRSRVVRAQNKALKRVASS